MAEEKRKPTVSSKLGRVEVATWAREKGTRTFYDSRLSLQYKVGENKYEDGEWYSEADLVALRACIDEVLFAIRLGRQS